MRKADTIFFFCVKPIWAMSKLLGSERDFVVGPFDTSYCYVNYIKINKWEINVAARQNRVQGPTNMGPSDLVIQLQFMVSHLMQPNVGPSLIKSTHLHTAHAIPYPEDSGPVQSDKSSCPYCWHPHIVSLIYRLHVTLGKGRGGGAVTDRHGPTGYV